MNKSSNLSIFFILLLSLTLNAQNTENNKSLSIGDKVPNIKIDQIVNGTKNKAKISDFKNQLLILDLMHTKCGSCIEALPKMDSLQKVFKDKLQILVVTFEKKDYVAEFLNSFDGGKIKKLNIPWVVEDKILKAHFPYTIVSHLAWIYKGKVLAITDKHQVTAKNIQDILNGKMVNLPVKNDLLEFDFDKDFFKVESNQGIDEMEVIKYSAIRGHIKGIDASGDRLTVDSLNQTTRLHIANRTILNMYSNAWIAVNENKLYVRPNRTIMEVKDPVKYEYKEEYGDRELWDEKNEITYESLLPLAVGKIGAYKKMITDLDFFLGLHGRWEKRKIPCLAIVKAATDQEIKEKKEQASKLPHTDYNGNFINYTKENNDTIFRFETKLMNLSKNKDMFSKPLIDESGYEGYIIFPNYQYKKGEYMAPKNDLESFKKGLQAVGFDLVEKECETDVFVLTELGNN